MKKVSSLRKGFLPNKTCSDTQLHCVGLYEVSAYSHSTAIMIANPLNDADYTRGLTFFGARLRAAIGALC
jgi:hypothetical protein